MGDRVKRSGRGYAVINGWMFNDLTYAASPYTMWLDNRLAQSYDSLSGDDRNWRSECFTALTGRGCRGWVEASVIETYRTASGSNAYRRVDRWVLNHMVRFDSTPIPPRFAMAAIGCEDAPGGRNLTAAVVDPDGRGYNLLFLTGAEKVDVVGVGTTTVKVFHANHTCIDSWGGVALS